MLQTPLLTVVNYLAEKNFSKFFSTLGVFQLGSRVHSAPTFFCNLFLWFCDVTIEFPEIGKKQILAFFGNQIEFSATGSRKNFFFIFLLVLITIGDGVCNWYLSNFLNLLGLGSENRKKILLAAFFRFSSWADFITSMRDLKLSPLYLRYKKPSG